MAERDAWAATGIDTEVVARRDAEGTRTMGGALVAALVASAEERGVEIVAACGVDDLEYADGWWTLAGVRARAVVLASGGFEWNPRLQAAFLPNPVTPISAPSNTGDGLELGLAAGAAVATMVGVWGVPVLADPAHVYDGRPSGRMANVELTLPGSVLVNARGRRFVNEATNYHDLNKAFRTIDSATGTHAHIPAWMVVDSAYVARYSIGGTPAGTAPAWAERGDTVDELAQRCGIDPAGLAATLAEFNRHAAQGRDPHFHRGESAAGPPPRRRHAPAPLPRAAGAGPLLRDPDPPRHARHLRRARHRRRRPRARPARPPDHGPVRGRERLGHRVRRRVPRWGCDAGVRDHAGLRRRARARPSPLGTEH